MNKERLDYLFEYFNLLRQTPEEFRRMRKVADEIDSELKINEPKMVTIDIKKLLAQEPK